MSSIQSGESSRPLRGVTTDDDTYTARFAPVASLNDDIRAQMARIYLASYDSSNPAIFFGDLAAKDEVLLLYAGAELIGFTTLRTFDYQWEGRTVRVVYSGDTVVERAHWGQQALAFAWISRMGAMKRERPDTPLFWLLLVKGHRTFRYLPVFGKSFYPHWSIDRSDLKPLTDALAKEMFSSDYNPATGVVEFAESRGHLKPHLALPTAGELDRDGVRFFLERNPGFQRGHELVCLCEVEEENMKPLTLRLFRKGLRAG